MPPLEREANRLRSLVDDADAIIVGIGSGMSSAAGFNHYNRAGMARARMEDWQRSFGFKGLFDGFYHLYPSLEQQWAYYARYIDFMLREPASQPYLDLRALIGHKDYFILSTNVDAQVEKTFPAERVCNYQGSFARLQCKQPCCDELFDAGLYVERMLAGMARFEGCYSRYFAGGFALWRCRNGIGRYSAVPNASSEASSRYSSTSAADMCRVMPPRG